LGAEGRAPALRPPGSVLGPYGKAAISRRADRHDGTVADDDSMGWAGYYAWSAGRKPRPLLLAACEELGTGQDRMAIDLGCGEGTDALELLARGWLVMAVDVEPAGLALLRARIPPPAAGRIRVLRASFTEADLPCAYLIHAGYRLPFCPPQECPALWARIRQALAPGGVFAGQLFGIRDTWADDPDLTFHTRHQVEVMLDGLDILRLEETERDGHAFSGPKHWHTLDILARKRPPG
jgi:SAM-dependent methyltransferase